MSIYHLSKTNLEKNVLHPRIPENYMTKNKYEDNITPRICFCPSIRQSIMALCRNCSGETLFVHIPMDSYPLYYPTKDEVPDVKITNEIWIKEDVRLKCIGIIYIDGPSDNKYKIDYCDKETYSYEFHWHWIEKFNLFK